MGKMAFGAGVLVTDLRCGSAVMQMHADADHDTDTPTCFEALGTKDTFCRSYPAAARGPS